MTEKLESTTHESPFDLIAGKKNYESRIKSEWIKKETLVDNTNNSYKKMLDYVRNKRETVDIDKNKWPDDFKTKEEFREYTREVAKEVYKEETGKDLETKKDDGKSKEWDKKD